GLMVDGQVIALFIDRGQAVLDGAQERLVLLFVCCDVDGLNVLAPRAGRRRGGALFQHGHLRPPPLLAAFTSFCLACMGLAHKSRIARRFALAQRWSRSAVPVPEAAVRWLSRHRACLNPS